MVDTLSSLERAILEQIAFAPENRHLGIKSHIPYLSVRSREITGVGAYVYFDDSSPAEILSADLNEKTIFSSRHIAEIDVLANGLGYALSAEQGKLKFLEFFTYGDESWDGTYGSYSFLDI